jgi:hypothetical protein
VSIQRLDPKVLLLVSELAEMADVSADTVYREIKAGQPACTQDSRLRSGTSGRGRPLAGGRRAGVVSPPTENAPPFEWGASKTIARQRPPQLTSTTMCQRQILARAGALCVATSAMATGTFEPSQSMIEATAVLASSLAFDIWILAEEGA